MRLIDITGQRFGRLSVVKKADRASPSGGSLWECLCDCGATKTVNASNLRNGGSRSCGCLAGEWSKSMGSNPAFVAKRAASQVRHGHKKRGNASPEYKTWLGMKARCERPTNKDYPRWGGRGIRVCDRWQDFAAFFADMGPKPSPSHSIDRLDPDANYEPGNCRWATPAEQGGENKRSNRPVIIDGVSYPTVTAACRAFNTPLSRMSMRLQNGHDIVSAITTPLRGLPNTRTRESYLPRTSRD